MAVGLVMGMSEAKAEAPQEVEPVVFSARFSDVIVENVGLAMVTSEEQAEAPQEVEPFSLLARFSDVMAGGMDESRHLQHRMIDVNVRLIRTQEPVSLTDDLWLVMMGQGH
jgi:hypothetical protein